MNAATGNARHIKQEDAPQVHESTMLDLCKLVYSEMERTATKAEGQTEDALIWEGALTSIFQLEPRLGTSRYSAVMNALKRMDCVYQLQRGGGSAPSVWMLYRPPTEELYTATKLRESTRKANSGVMDQRFGDVARTLESLTRRLEIAERKLEGLMKI